MSIIECRAVIFDLDGLVLDSESTYFVAWRQAAAEMGHDLDEAFCISLSGLHGTNVYARLQQFCGSGFDIDRFNRQSRDYWLAYVRRHGIPVKKGFFELLALIGKLELPFALATNSRREDAEFCLARAGLENVFPVSVSRDDVSSGKPAPDIFQKAAALLALQTRHCLVLEDSPVGIAAARAAGSPCVFVPSVKPVDELAASSADWVFDDLTQVADFISAQFSHPL